MTRILKNLNESAIARAVLVIGLGALTVASMPRPSAADPQPAIAMYGQPALPAEFAHLPYVNPEAPKGGTIRLAEPGSFDSLRPWVLKGNPVWPLFTEPGLVVETLMFRSIDEPFSLYGLLAESIETDPERSWVAFTLRPEAKFSDGTPVTVEDVIWSFETLGTKGHPRYLGTWKKVSKIEKTGERTLRITFTAPDRELPLLMGMRPVLQKKQWEGKDFAQSGLEAPIGSGPYVVDKVDAGRSVTFRRNPDYWGRDLPVNKGLNNADVIRYDYFGDAGAMFEAFKAGDIDAWRELNGAKWARDYGFPAVTDGRVIKAEIPHSRPSGIIGLAMNTRRPQLADWRVREALTQAFNFRFINQTLGAGSDKRITSYFSNSALAMQPGPASGKVAELLAPFAADLPPGTIEGTALPEGSDKALDRKAMRSATALLAEAGWTVQDGTLKNAAGEPFPLEILLNQSGSAMRSGSEVQQIVDIYVEALRPLGIQPKVTLLDSAQYVERTNGFNFDMTWYERGLTLSPGNEQLQYWGSAAADEQGSKNWPGIRSPAVDAMIAAMLAAQTPEDHAAAVQALDRLLTAGRYVIPVSFPAASRIAYSAKLAHPEALPLYGDWPGFLPTSWWVKP